MFEVGFDSFIMYLGPQGSLQRKDNRNIELGWYEGGIIILRQSHQKFSKIKVK